MTDAEIRSALLGSDDTGIMIPFAQIPYDPDAPDDGTLQRLYDIADAENFQCERFLTNRVMFFVRRQAADIPR